MTVSLVDRGRLILTRGIRVDAATDSNSTLHSQLSMPWIDGILQWWLAHVTGACLFGPPLILFSSKAEFRWVHVQREWHTGVGAHGVLYRRTTFLIGHLRVIHLCSPQREIA